MNPAQLKAQIDAAAIEAYKQGRQEGAREAVDKARTMMPTILANAYKQAVTDTAGFFKNLSVRGESYPDIEAAADKLIESGELPEQEVKTPGGVAPMQRVVVAGPDRFSGPPARVESMPNTPFQKVNFLPSYNGHDE